MSGRFIPGAREHEGGQLEPLWWVCQIGVLNTVWTLDSSSLVLEVRLSPPHMASVVPPPTSDPHPIGPRVGPSGPSRARLTRGFG